MATPGFREVHESPARPGSEATTEGPVRGHTTARDCTIIHQLICPDRGDVGSPFEVGQSTDHDSGWERVPRDLELWVHSTRPTKRHVITQC